METKLVFLLGLVVLLLAGVSYSLADSQADVGKQDGVDPQSKDTNTSGGKKDESKLVSSSKAANTDNKKQVNQASESKDSGAARNTSKDDPRSESESKGNDGVGKGKSKSTERFPEKKSDHETDENPTHKLEPKVVPKQKSDKEGPVENLNHPGKEGSHAEQCDPSNQCTDKEKKLIACLRVPGNESPLLSLFIQNKGKGPLDVKISAPDFVELENKSIHLEENHDTKVRVSITNEGSDNLIVLTAGNSECKLDIKDLIARDFGKEFNSSRKFNYTNFISRPIIAILSFGALLILASSWMCISSRRKQGSKYQRLDMELPVSAVPKTESVVNDGWDNSWGDDWDEEEAPHTPSLPVTPSPSSKGLASRRLNKEGWKD